MSGLSYLAHPVASPDEALPLPYALAAGVVALYASFEVLRLRRATPLDAPGRPLPRVVAGLLEQDALRAVLGLLGSGVTAWLLVALLAGPPDPANPGLRLVYGLFWPGLAPASLLFGPVFVALSPIRWLHRFCYYLLRRPPERGFVRLPESVGYWPAGLALLAFAWWELISPERESPRATAWWLLSYAAVQLAAALVFGAGWLSRGEGFEVYSRLVGQLAPIGRRADGRLVLRRPLAGLAQIPTRPGLTTTAGVLVSATLFDSLSELAGWRSSGEVVVPTAALLAMLGLVVTLFTGAARFGAVLGGARPEGAGSALAHSLVPIAAGYLIAHYFTAMLLAVQDLPGSTAVGAEEPLAVGGDDAGVLPPVIVISLIQVAAVLTGHVLGALAGHRRMGGLVRLDRITAAQLPLLAVMLLITLGGLVLLYRA